MMGFNGDPLSGGGGDGAGGNSLSSGIRGLLRRKQVDSNRVTTESGHPKLAKELSILQLMAIVVNLNYTPAVYFGVCVIPNRFSFALKPLWVSLQTGIKHFNAESVVPLGVGSTIGAGVYVLVGTVAREHSGPALTISFLIAGIAAALSAFCYAELASRCPSAGSAYHYSYICVGEGVAWLIGWALILEYTIGGSAVARGISPNLALLFGGADSLPFFLSRMLIPGTDIVVDPCAAILVLVVTGLLCVGIKESSFVQAIVTTANLFVMVFIIIVGGYLGFKTGWTGYELPSGFLPFGVNGMLAGSATVFFAYIGFDSVASTAEEVKNPQRDLPLGIGASLSICCSLYMLVSVVIVGLVPYYAMDPDTPISSAFASHGMQWAVYIITAGAVTALCSTLMGSILPQPRILMAMSRDGLLPPFFADVNRRTQVPVKSTILTGVCAAMLAFFMDVSQLAGMVSVGTLLAFTIVAISILILRYVPPDTVPLSQSFLGSIGPIPSYSISQENDGGNQINHVATSSAYSNNSLAKEEASVDYPLIVKQLNQEKASEQERRRIAAWSITAVCVGVLSLTSGSSAAYLPIVARYSVCGTGGILLLCGLIALSCIDQDDARHTFGHTGGFICPFVPLLPIACILINVYLMINLGAGTWIRVSMWMVVGVFVYVVYGRKHSLLLDAVYVSTEHADEIYQNSVEYVA
ncbi:hypothetical protein C5167_045704 [Papaver somniferum]|uniref:Cationic amino acid transporter C-terminal domain-containing protein n=2 Tax=Magnoliopsida TaxID=3398 RepID=A0A4Y7LCH1_PAPSO|nr:hypothetical protein C5167_045704 [Papaver somniferum]